MLERIRQILATRALSPTQFADTIGIGRPVVSHILSGRNKPSLEVIQKIVDAFPDLALPWLLKGEGSMLTSELPASPPVEAVSVPAVSRSRKAPRPAGHSAPEPTSGAAKPASDSLSAQPVDMVASGIDGSVATAATTALTVAPAPATTPPVPVAQASAVAPALPNELAATVPDKAIRRIIIFYRDGTFTDYQPEA